MTEITLENLIAKPEAGDRPSRRWTAGELLRESFPEQAWAIPGILPEGLTILAGRPKIGKSWLALQSAVGVGTGGMVLGQRVDQGSVLYVALEDGARRLQDRMRAQGSPEKADISFSLDWKPLSDGGLIDLENEMTLRQYRLVVIDTISRALGGDDQLDLAVMTRVLGALQRLAQDRHTALLLIDHHRKSAGFNADPVDDVLGSTGKSAVADCLIGLYKERGKPGATLNVTGRDMPDRTLALSWDGEFSCWQYQGEAGKVREDERGKVLKAIQEIHEAGDLPTTTKISESAAMVKPNVSNVIMALITDGLVSRGEKVGVQQPYYPINTVDNKDNKDNNGDDYGAML